MLASDGIPVKLKPGKSVFEENLDGKKKIFLLLLDYMNSNLEELEIKL